MKVKIIKCSFDFWYSRQIGSIVNVLVPYSGDNKDDYTVPGLSATILRDDAEIIEEVKPENGSTSNETFQMVLKLGDLHEKLMSLERELSNTRQEFKAGMGALSYKLLL